MRCAVTDKLRERVAILEELNRRKAQNKLAYYEPYDKQRKFHELGLTHRERMISSGNQQGKTFCGAMELAQHLTGRYIDGWPGRRFSAPITAWMASVTSESTRDNGQRLLLGPLGSQGEGAIPADCIMEVRAGRGVADLADTVVVKHVSGRNSLLAFKSFERGREKFAGASLEVVWLDEEPPEDVYSECLARISARKGLLYLTATPLLGMSAVVTRFFNEQNDDRALVQMGIDDAHHIAPEERQKIIDGYQPHERDARVMGIPLLGSGRVYQIAESVISVAPIEIPPHWPKIWGVDFGVRDFAASLVAWDRDNDVAYLVDCFKSCGEVPAVHAAAIRARGDYPVAWPHDGEQREKSSGVSLAGIYKAAGLPMLDEPAHFDTGGNSVEAGILMLTDRMRQGRFKVFSNLAPFWEEYRLYHRVDGRIKKQNDHVLDSVRYASMSLRHARTGDARTKRRVIRANGLDYDICGDRAQPGITRNQSARGRDYEVTA